MTENDQFTVKFEKDPGRSEEIDRLLVQGELVTDAEGNEIRVYPKSCDVAERMGVSQSWVSKFAKRNRCFERRKELRRKASSIANETVARREAKRIVFDVDRMLRMCDRILLKFEEAIERDELGKVTATDVNTIMRVRKFVQGEPDSRGELINGGLSLESIQAAHKKMLDDMNNMTPEMCGMVPDTWSTRSNSQTPLAPSTEDDGGDGQVDHKVDHETAK